MNGKRLSFLVVGTTLLMMGVFLFPGGAQAQERKVKVGGKAGFNISRVRGEAFDDDGVAIDFNTGNGFSLGGLVAVDVHPNVTFQPEFLFSRKKVEAPITIDGETVDREIETDFFEVPILAKLHASGDQPVRFFGLAGATLSFLTGAEQTLMLAGETAVEDIEDELISTDVGITVGGGADFAQDWGVVTVDARYTFGLRRFSDDDGDDIKLDTFLVSGGIIF